MTVPAAPGSAKNGARAASVAAVPKSPFVASVRARADTIRVGDGGGWMVRAQLSEVWDAVRLDVAPSTPVSVVREHALAALLPDAGIGDEFVVKLNGMEVLDEHASVADVGALNGSTFLIAYRRRRPIR